MMFRAANFLAISFSLLATVVQGGSVVEGTAAENSERVLKAKKGTIAPGVPAPKSQKKVKSAFKGTKEPKMVKKKSKKAKGTDVPSNAPSSASVLTSNPTGSPSAAPSQSPSIKPVEPFGPVEAFVAVPTGTDVAVVSAAVETASIDTILQNGIKRRKLQEATEAGSTEQESAILDSVPESVHRMLQVNTIGSIQIRVVPTPCDCVLVGGLIFQTSDACDCYDCFISGTVGFPNRAVIILTGSISNGTFGLRINQIIPGSNAQGSPFATTSPSSAPAVPSSAPTESVFPSTSPISSF